MNRREVLKAMAVVPFANALGNCLQTRTPYASGPSNGTRVHTVQVLFEGAFALVLRKGDPSKLIAFVPRPEHEDPPLAHKFYFNNPSMARPEVKGPEGYHFQLAGEGLRTYAEPYINPGFKDFEATTEKWRLGERLVTVELPFPNSVNFSGRPLNVEFQSRRRGQMPTNHVLEYYVDEPEKIRLMCSQLEGKCSSSPNCPPGIIRFFFGVSPLRKDKDEREHVVKFFNFMLRNNFPDLEKQYALLSIEPSEENRKPGSNDGGKVRPAVFNADIPARLVQASAVLDCQSAGLIVHASSGPIG